MLGLAICLSLKNSRVKITYLSARSISREEDYKKCFKLINVLFHLYKYTNFYSKKSNYFYTQFLEFRPTSSK